MLDTHSIPPCHRVCMCIWTTIYVEAEDVASHWAVFHPGIQEEGFAKYLALGNRQWASSK